MSEPDPDFDVVHPSGHLMFRCCAGGYLHNVVLSEASMDTDEEVLAQAVLRAAEVSHLKAVMQIRREIVAAGFSPSSELPTAADLSSAEAALAGHQLTDER